MFGEDGALNLDHSEIRRRLLDELGDENEWFVELLFSVNDWRHQGIPVTDILIRENNPIFYSAVKSFAPVVKFGNSSRSGNEFVGFTPRREHLRRLIYRLLKYEEFIDSTLDALDGRYTSIDVALPVKGLGIFRLNISFNEDLFSDDGYSISISMRYLDFTIPKFESLSYPKEYQDFFRRLVAKGSMKSIIGEMITVGTVRTGGLILHVGPTGSGKTTSIAAEIKYLAENTEGTILTYENPIEYRFIGTKAPVRQYEIGTHIKEDDEFDITDKILRHLLRNNPSIVLYGEARTRKEMKALLDVASRGHLIFSTIHANNVKEALSTMMSVAKDEPYLLANGLIAIIGHRLVLNKDGEIVPLYEFFVPDKVDKRKIADKDLQTVYQRFYSEKANTSSFSFKEHINKLVKEGKLEEDEGRHIIMSAPLVFDPMGQGG